MPRLLIARQLRAAAALLCAVALIVSLAPLAAPAAATAPAQKASPAGYDRGDSYMAGGAKIALLRRADQLALALRGAKADSLARLTGPGGALSGFHEARALRPDLIVLERNGPAPDGPATQASISSVESAIAAAAADPAVAWAAPVFHSPASGGWLVAADELIVALAPGARPEAVFAGVAEVGGYRPLPGTPDQFIASLAAGGLPALALAERLRAMKGVAWATPNFYQAHRPGFSPNDPLIGQQWHLNNTGQSGGLPNADAEIFEAWEISQGGSAAVVVAVLDDGMEYSHPDLAPNLWANPGEVAGNGLDDDGNGWVDDLNGYDFTGAGDSFPGASSPSDAHATSVAGVLAAAGDNGLGVAGVAYRSRLMAVRIFGDNGSAASDAAIASAIYYAAGRTANGLGTWGAADILNNSWGGGAPNDAIIAAFTWAGQNGRGGRGAASFIATGNDGPTAVAFPASLAGSVAGVIAVGASTDQDLRAGYSQVGPQVDVVAPSNGGSFGIVTVDRQGINGYNDAAGTAGDYTSTAASAFGGTSSATPLAAGIGALLLALDPNLSAAALRGLLRSTTDLIGPLEYPDGRNDEYGAGRVNALAALRGVGVAELQVLDGRASLSIGGSISFVAPTGSSQTRVFRVRNQGSADLSLAGLAISGSPAFSLEGGFADTSLSVGESTTFSVRFAPSSAGDASASLSFTSNDADEGSFALSLSGQGQATSAAGVVYEDWDGDGDRDADEPRVAGQQIYLDLNSDGMLNRFSGSRSPSLAIPDNNVSGIQDTLVISGASGSVADVSVTVTISHTWVGDVRARLIAPDGTSVSLIDQRGGSGNDLDGTTFEDEAADSISQGSAPFSGRFRPEAPLAGLSGQSLNGSWRLEVADLFTGDVGTLVSWSLTLLSEPVSRSDSVGFYRFLQLDPGSYSVRLALPSGSSLTEPAGGAHTANVVDANTINGDMDFGLVRQNAIYGDFFADQNRDGARGPGEPGLANQISFIDRNGDGTLSQSRAEQWANLSIPDANAAGVRDSITLSGVAGTVAAVEVRISLRHTYAGDLRLELISPAGTPILLVDRRGGAGQDFSGTIFADWAALEIAAVEQPDAPFAGAYRPEQPLASLRGEGINGTWQLRVADLFGADTGVLESWSLTVASEESRVSDSAGRYRFDDMAAGVYTVRAMLRLGNRLVAPPAEQHLVTLTPGGSSFGSRFAVEVDGFGSLVWLPMTNR